MNRRNVNEDKEKSLVEAEFYGGMKVWGWGEVPAVGNGSACEQAIHVSSSSFVVKIPKTDGARMQRSMFIEA